MAGRYAQACILFSTPEEKARIKEYCDKHGGMSKVARMLLLKALRDGWEYDFRPKEKEAA